MSEHDAEPVPLTWGPPIEAHPLAHHVHDVHSLRLLAANDAARVRYGYARDEFARLSLTDLLLPGQAALPAAGQPAAAFRRAVWLERTRDGRVLQADVCGVPVLFEGRPARLLVVLDAVVQPHGPAASAKTSAETSAETSAGHASAERLAALLAAMPDLWFILDADLRYADVSNPKHPSLSAPWPAKVGRSIEESGSPEHVGRVRRLVAAAHASGQPQIYRYTMDTLAGPLRYYEGRFVPMTGGRTLLLVRDTTETVQLEHRFQATAEAAPVAIFRADADGALNYANAAWQQLLGLDGGTLPGAAWLAVLHADDRAAVQRQWAAAAAAGQVFDREFRLRRGDGSERTVQMRSNPLRDADGALAGHVGTVIDVTQARELEAAQRARAVAEEAGRRQTHFMSRVSHELRTPLNAILGFGQILQRAVNLPTARCQAYAGHIVQAGERMLGLVDDLLELQRLEQGLPRLNPVPLDIGRLLDNCADLLRPLADAAGMSLQANAPLALQVHTDERSLRQMLLNLITNAIQHGRGGRHTVRLLASREGGQVSLQVIDEGAGMTPEQLHSLFRPFERLGLPPGTRQGSGLGLVITRQLAQAIGAEVGIHSQPGVGTTATVRLPQQLPG